MGRKEHEKKRTKRDVNLNRIVTINGSSKRVESFIDDIPEGTLNVTFDIDRPAQRGNDNLPNIGVDEVHSSIVRNIPPQRPRFNIQRRRNTSISRKALIRLLRTIRADLGFAGNRYTVDAVKILHLAAEDMLVQFFEFSTILTHHRRRVTLSVDDFRSLISLRKDLIPWLSNVRLH